MSEQCTHLLDYFNRSLTIEEERTFEQHLEECPSCAAELEELYLLTADLPYLAEEVDVPSDLKSNVFAAIDEKHEGVATVKPFPQPTREQSSAKKKGFAIPLLAAALIASIITNAYLVTMDREPTSEIAQSDLQLIGKALLDPQPGADNASAVAMMIKDNNETVLLVDANNLPTLKDNEVYQVWVIEKDTPQPAGSFTPSADGNGTVTYPMDGLQGDYDTVAITIETEPNLPLPEGSLILAGTI